MGNRSGFDADGTLSELTNVVDLGSGAVSAATRQAMAQANLGLLPSGATAQVTPGTATASSVMITDSNNSIAGLTTVQGTNLTAGTATGTAGTLTIYPGTTTTGKTTITMSANSGATTTNINVAAQAGARTYTVPDAGASANFLMSLGASVAVGSTLAVTDAMSGQVLALNTVTGSVATLPAATGSGARFRFYVSVLATSNSHIIYTATANGVGGTADNMVGVIMGTRVDSGNAVLGFAGQSTSNTITLNRTTTGSVSLGEYVDVIDVATHVWQVSGMLSATGAAFATPFSHT